MSDSVSHGLSVCVSLPLRCSCVTQLTEVNFNEGRRYKLVCIIPVFTKLIPWAPSADSTRTSAEPFKNHVRVVHSCGWGWKWGAHGDPLRGWRYRFAIISSSTVSRGMRAAVQEPRVPVHEGSPACGGCPACAWERLGKLGVCRQLPQRWDCVGGDDLR